MKNKHFILMVLLSLSFIVKLSAMNFTFNGSTSVFPVFYVHNNSYLSNTETSSVDMVALEDASFRFEPVDTIYAQMDASCYGSVIQYKNNNTAVSIPFTIDINQLYVGIDTNSTHTYIGKKVFNYGFSTNFPLVNQINPRRNDKIRYESEGTGVVATTLSAVDWTSFSSILYYDSDDKIGNPEDLSVALITDFYYKNFTLSVYSYFKNQFCFNSDMAGNLFTNFEKFKEEMNEYGEQMQFPAAFSGSAQLGLFTLYGEILYQSNPLKFHIVEDNGVDSLERVGKSSYWDATAGVRFVSSQFTVEAEYCNADSGYSAEEADELYEYIKNYPSDKDSAIAEVYDGVRIFYKQNASLSCAYTPAFLPQLTVSLADKISFPSYGCDSTYVGNLITMGITYTMKQTLLLACSSSYGFGGDRSEYTLYNENTLSIVFDAKLYY
jgi:hypothetical protein